MGLGPGERFARYTIVRPLGHGGQGRVFLAVDTVLEREVALKVIRPETIDEESVARFEREAKLAAKLSHPHTIQIFDLGTAEGIHFIAMEYIQGAWLRRWCGEPSVPTPRKLRWMLDVARGLAAAHKRDLIHRDIKPENIIVSDDDVVKIVDFGLAKRTKVTDRMRATFKTQFGFVVGTEQFMAPEQMAGKPIDARVDQYSWGLTAYTLFLGENPRAHDLVLPVPPKLAGTIPGITKSIDRILARTLAEEPEKRWPSMQELVKALEIAQTTGEVESKPKIAVAIPRAAEPIERISMEPPLPAQADYWRFEHRADRCPVAPIYAAAFSADGRKVFAFGPAGLAIHEGRWRKIELDPAFPASFVTCAAAIGDDTVVVGGEESIAARIHENGAIERFEVARAGTILFRGVAASPDGAVVRWVGASNDVGVLARLHRDTVAVETTLHMLRGITLVGKGALACGPVGALVSLGSDLVELPRVTSAHLRALAQVGRITIAVGTNGTAVCVGGDTFIPEATGTSSTLEAIASAGDGTAWAGSDRGRLVRRDASGAWRRMSPEWGVDLSVVGIWCDPQRVRAVAKDGSLLAGWRSR